MARWKDIAGYEGLYRVSDKGDILALPKIVREGNRQYTMKEKLLKVSTRGKHGAEYRFVVLTKNGIPKAFSIHRIVAEAFIPNPDGLPEVNHKDENTFNNAVENLEWCTRRYNIEYSKAKSVEQINGGEIIARFRSIVRASEATGIGRRSINNALKGWTKTAGGYEWRYC
jgi:hypothetical protein